MHERDIIPSPESDIEAPYIPGIRRRASAPRMRETKEHKLL